MFGTLNLEWLNSEIKDSPIVDQDYLLSFFVGAMYTF
ncbi:MAG: MipA/OmpV family protein [Phycisphaerae bacterium]|nr:MipA/OmpV family protein [Phycisphaerae bacterium]